LNTELGPVSWEHMKSASAKRRASFKIEGKF
jgi:hypothetical protein